MYYLRKEPYPWPSEDIIGVGGTVTTPKHSKMAKDRAIYKSHRFTRFYRQHFYGVDEKIPGMKLYTCKTMKRILEVREAIYDYCGEWFDVYNESGKVDIQESVEREHPNQSYLGMGTSTN